MKLVYADYQLKVDLCENQVAVITIENPAVYSNVLQELWKQTHGETGKFILSDQGMIKPIAKWMECVMNPFAVDCNEKKIINRLYQELKEQADGVMFEDSMMLNREIVCYLEKLIFRVPYALEYDLDLNVAALLKCYDVRIVKDNESLLEKIVEYMKVSHQICNVQIFVFVALKQYLSETEIRQLYEFVLYEKIYLIIVDAHQEKRIPGEMHWIIDKDLCIIELR